MSAYSKDLCVIQFNEATKLGEVKRRVLNAFLEGIMCFQFILHAKGRKFRDCVALPKDADEAVALEMAEFQFSRYVNTVAKLAVGG